MHQVVGTDRGVVNGAELQNVIGRAAQIAVVVHQHDLLEPTTLMDAGRPTPCAVEIQGGVNPVNAVAPLVCRI